MTPDTTRRIAALGLTQREFAKQTGVSFASVNRWGHTVDGFDRPEPAWVGSWLAAWERVAEMGGALPWKERASAAA